MGDFALHTGDLFIRATIGCPKSEFGYDMGGMAHLVFDYDMGDISTIGCPKAGFGENTAFLCPRA